MEVFSLKCIVSPVDSLMHRKLTTLSIAEATVLTDVGLFPSVGIHMLLVTKLGTEAFVADCTYVLVFLQVGKCVVPLHVELVSVLLSTVWTQ